MGSRESGNAVIGVSELSCVTDGAFSRKRVTADRSLAIAFQEFARIVDSRRIAKPA